MEHCTICRVRWNRHEPAPCTGGAWYVPETDTDEPVNVTVCLSAALAERLADTLDATIAALAFDDELADAAAALAAIHATLTTNP